MNGIKRGREMEMVET